MSYYRYEHIILISHKENEPPDQAVLATILKEVKEIDQIQNDSLCKERRILGMLTICNIMQ